MTRNHGLGWLRVGMPISLAVVGLLVALLGPATLGMALIAVAIAVFAANMWIRFSFSSQADREREAEARRTFTRTGRWP